MFYILIFMIGVSIGSFLNVLIDRLPQEETITGRSHCDHCKKDLAWYDLLPIVSFIYLGGRCRFCRKKLSFFYPLVEVITGISFISIFNFPALPAGRQFSIFSEFSNSNPSINSGLVLSAVEWTKFLNLNLISNYFSIVALMGIVSSAIVIFFSDLKYQIIPDSIEVSLFAFSFLFLATHGVTPKVFTDQVVAAFAVMLPILLLFLLTKSKAMGFGDVKLAFNMGFLLGLMEGLMALYIGFVSGAVVGIILIFFKKKGLKSKIAFGPFLILGILIMLFFGDSVVQIVRTMYTF